MIDLLAEVRRERQRRAKLAPIAASTLAAACWRDRKYRPIGWQTELSRLCDDVIDSVFTGEGSSVLLSAPPRHGKTELVGRAMPARAFARAAQERRPFAVMYMTATHTRAKEVSLAARRVVERLYRETGDDHFKPGDTWTATEWCTRGGLAWVGCGWRASTGGIDAHLVILDDVIGSSQVYRSPELLSQIRTVIQADALARMQPEAAVVHMETRRGLRDTTGWLAAEYGHVWRSHVWRCYDEDRGYLWPEKFGAEWRAKRPHLTDASPIWRSLYQQEPIPDGGLILEHDWTTATYPADPAAHRDLVERVVAGVDLTRGGGEGRDKWAIVVVGVLGAFRDVLAVVTGRSGYVEQRAALREVCAEWRPSVVGVELAANGEAIVDELRGEIPGIVGYNATRDKVARLTPHLPRWAARQIRTPAPVQTWTRGYLEEHRTFSGTAGDPDDQVDATVWALVAADGAPEIGDDDLEAALSAW